MSARTLPGSPITVFTSSARTTSATSDVFRIQGKQYRGLCIQINATAKASTPSVTWTLQHQTGGVASSDDWANVIVSTALTDVGTINIVVHPSAADIANLSESSTTLKGKWRMISTASDSDSLTYSVIAYPLV